jgi:undecaprenyl-diphosphatase
LGLLQGLTEFLPVSSSGHIVLTQNLLGVKQTGVTFEVLVHLGSLLAVVIYFRVRFKNLILSLFDSEQTTDRKTILFLILGTLPAVVAVLFFKDFFEESFSNPSLTSFMLILTGLILLSSRFNKKGNKNISTISAIIMGIGQAMAIMPGISRSGTTIVAGMHSGVKPSEAAEFSFLLSVPAILGAFVFKFDELMLIGTDLIGQYIVGIIVTFVSSLFAIYAVLKLIKKGKFEYFAYYCFAAGALGLYLL